MTSYLSLHDKRQEIEETNRLRCTYLIPPVVTVTDNFTPQINIDNDNVDEPQSEIICSQSQNSICDVNVNNEQYISNVDSLTTISLSDHELLSVSSVDHVTYHSFDNVNHMERR